MTTEPTVTLRIPWECREAAAKAKLCEPDDWHARALGGWPQPCRYAEGVMVEVVGVPPPNEVPASTWRVSDGFSWYLRRISPSIVIPERGGD